MNRGDGGPSADLVLLDGDLVPRERALVSAFDRGLLYGESLFETLKVVDGAPCLWEPHRDRLTAGCDELGLPFDPARLESGVRRLLGHRPVAHGALRVQVTGGEQPGGGRGLTAPAAGRRPRVVASVAETAPLPASVRAAGVRVVTAPGLTRSLPRLKSGNYLASIRAKGVAEAADAYECLLVGGEPPGLLEGAFSNVVVWDGRVLAVPPAEVRLPGVTMGVMLEAAARAGMPVVERPVPLEEFGGVHPRAPGAPDTAGTTGRAGAVLLLTGSLVGVVACSHLDDLPLTPAGELATGLYEMLLAREVESRRAWLEGARPEATDASA